MFALLLILTCCQLWSWPAESAAISEPVPILKSLGLRLSSGTYLFMYENGDGSYREELGIVGSDDLNVPIGDLEVSGVYGYVDDKGQELQVRYKANKNNGFLPHVKYVSAGQLINKSP
ncbi:endocuticle structural glycoprotein SgAbd-9 [Drosophila takahashii]|uniref:endocuticle structural glycoprotein SgAbd-9 n=1 Tax=Drosophila takahashii TaxID=29030 RepID=UPI001CF7FF90|nr:endocuticle structural glycoprotein SgAbd-9 [Drosophila takahashii]